MRFVSLKYDFAFREVFAHESVRKRFISDVTGIPPEAIQSVRLTTPYLRKRYQKQKQGILDIALILNDDTRVDIELQVRPQKYWIKRNLFYLAKMYTEDLKSGQRYEGLRKCIAISILDFDLLPGDEYHSVYTLRDKFGNEFTDLLEIHIIELNKKIRPEDAVGEWIQVFTAGSLEELEMIKTKNAGILEAMEVMKTMSLGKRLRMAYEAHLKAVRDRWAEDEYVRDLGKKEGKAEGKAEVLLLLLAEKGSVPAALSEIIRREKDTDRLDEWVKIAAKAGSIDEFRAKSKI